MEPAAARDEPVPLALGAVGHARSADPAGLAMGAVAGRCSAAGEDAAEDARPDVKSAGHGPPLSGRMPPVAFGQVSGRGRLLPVRHDARRPRIAVGTDRHAQGGPRDDCRKAFALVALQPPLQYRVHRRRRRRARLQLQLCRRLPISRPVLPDVATERGRRDRRQNALRLRRAGDQDPQVPLSRRKKSGRW